MPVQHVIVIWEEAENTRPIILSHVEENKYIHATAYSTSNPLSSNLHLYHLIVLPKMFQRKTAAWIMFSGDFSPVLKV